MRHSFLTLILLTTAALLPAQEPGIGAAILRPEIYDQAKQYLGLSDAQMQSLQSIQNARNQAQQNYWNQINEKNRTLYQLLDSGTGSPAQIGQLMLDIRNLEKQMPTIEAPFRQQAVNVLSADQKTKLAKLNEALQLQQTASQAVQLLLLEYPRYIGLPMPVEPNGGPGSGLSSMPARPSRATAIDRLR